MHHIFVSVCLIAASALTANAATCQSDGSPASVQACHDWAQNGDTITLPAGAFTWANGVTIRKGVTLQGIENVTTINRASGFNGVLVSIMNFTEDVPVRVTG